MMKSKIYLKNLAKRVLPLINKLFIIIFSLVIYGCSSSDNTHVYLAENVPLILKETVKTEYNLDIQAYLTGETFWVYLPVENLLKQLTKEEMEKEKYIEKFSIGANSCEFKDGSFAILSAIKSVKEEEKKQEMGFDKDKTKSISDVWTVIRRVLFSIDRDNSKEPRFIYFITSDIETGIEIQQLSYYPDLKKLSYGFISLEEYQHRTIQDTGFSAEAIGDKEGNHLTYYDVPMEEFIAKQIQHRIKLKFQKPEVEQTADIDKEIIKTAALVLKIYDFNDFEEIKINNLITNKKVSLNNASIWKDLDINR